MKKTRIFLGLVSALALVGISLVSAPAQQATPVEITVPGDISQSDRERISSNVNRFFGGISVGGSISTPLGGGQIIIGVGRQSPAPASGPRAADVSRFTNRTAEDVSRGFLCDVACNAAAAAAAAACGGAPPVIAACLATVSIARDECLRRC